MTVLVPRRVGVARRNRFTAPAPAPAGLVRESVGFVAAHDFEDDDLTPWTQVAGSWDTIAGRYLRNENADTGERILYAAIARGAMYVQGIIRINGTAVDGIGLAARMDPTTEDAYYVYFGTGSDEYGLKEVVAGTQADVDGPYSDLGNLAINTDYLARLYVADGEQKWTFHTSAVRTATDDSHDDEDDRSAGFYINEGNAAADPTADDFACMTGYTIVCTGLPTGAKLQIRDGADSLVAEAEESGGTATLDAFADDLTVPVAAAMAGWPKVEVRDSEDELLDDPIEPAGDAEDPLVCPGDVLAFS